MYVVTGPVLTEGPYETIGENEVAIPKRYYKVILDYKEPGLKAIGFILPKVVNVLPSQLIMNLSLKKLKST